MLEDLELKTEIEEVLNTSIDDLTKDSIRIKLQNRVEALAGKLLMPTQSDKQLINTKKNYDRASAVEDLYLDFYIKQL